MGRLDAVKIHVTDKRNIGALTRAKKLLEDYNALPSQISYAMIGLFEDERVNSEMIDVYKQLETRWKTLTNYKTNNNHII